MSKTLYILYNADASLMGKVKYSYKKICRTDGNPECAACQITHGGLSLNETSEWSTAKKELESEENIKVVQWHRDELSDQMKEFVSNSKSEYPLVVFDDGTGKLDEIMGNKGLTEMNGDAQKFKTEVKSYLQKYNKA